MDMLGGNQLEMKVEKSAYSTIWLEVNSKISTVKAEWDRMKLNAEHVTSGWAHFEKALELEDVAAARERMEQIISFSKLVVTSAGLCRNTVSEELPEIKQYIQTIHIQADQIADLEQETIKSSESQKPLPDVSQFDKVPQQLEETLLKLSVFELNAHSICVAADGMNPLKNKDEADLSTMRGFSGKIRSYALAISAPLHPLQGTYAETYAPKIEP